MLEKAEKAAAPSYLPTKVLVKTQEGEDLKT